VILVVGSTGLVGEAVCRGLRERGETVRALVRPDSPKEGGLAEVGAEIAHGDLKEPASIATACRDVDVVVTTATSTASRRDGDTLRTVDRDGQLGLVRVAREAGVKHFVLVSLSPTLPANCDLIRHKREVERAVRDSGMTWTILQPGAFMEIWFGPLVGWDLHEGTARIVGSGNTRISYVSFRDVAAFTVEGALNPAMRNRDIPVGAEPVTQNEAVRIFERVRGKKFRVQRVPVAVFRVGGVVLRPFTKRYSSLMRLTVAIGEGDVLEMDSIKAEFEISLTSVEEYAKSLV